MMDPVLGSSAEINPKLPPFLAPSSRLSGCGGAVIYDKLIGLFEELLSVGRGAMPTYVVGDIQITDPASYQAHIPRALASIARFGGRVIAGGGGKVDLLEGDPSPEWIFIIEFPTADAARRWYRSDDYQEALKVRRSASHGRVFLIEGAEISIALPVAGLDPGKA
jgi:uncharacterized protein (DUF1330 family)